MKKILFLLLMIPICSVYVINASAQSDSGIPDWIKNNAAWWSQDKIDDSSFLTGIKFLVENDVITLDDSKRLIDKGDFILNQQQTSNEFVNKEIFVDGFNYFEGQVDYLNQVFVLPNDIYLTIKDCGEPYFDYNYEKHEMIFCYELIELFYQANYDLGETESIDYFVLDAVDFSFYTLVGQTLDYEYSLPTTGNRIDVHDQFASYFILEFTDDVDVSTNTLFNYAYLLYTLDTSESLNDPEYFAYESTTEQRAYNISCHIYGKDSENWQYLVEEQFLPSNRAMGCFNEYENLVYSWDVLLEDYFK